MRYYEDTIHMYLRIHDKNNNLFETFIEIECYTDDADWDAEKELMQDIEDYLPSKYIEKFKEICSEDILDCVDQDLVYKYEKFLSRYKMTEYKNWRKVFVILDPDSAPWIQDLEYYYPEINKMFNEEIKNLSKKKSEISLDEFYDFVNTFFETLKEEGVIKRYYFSMLDYYNRLIESIHYIVEDIKTL